MNEQEKVVMGKIVDVWNEYLKLEKTYQDEDNDFRFHVHQLQNMLMARPESRNQINTDKRTKLNT